MTRARVVTLLASLVCVAAGNSVRAWAQEAEKGQPPAPQRVRISAGVAQGLLVEKVNPEYPREAREKKIQGTVKLKTEVSKEGDVTDLTLISGDPVLGAAAMEAVRQWKYKPYLLNGQPIAVETQVSVAFQLQAK